MHILHNKEWILVENGKFKDDLFEKCENKTFTAWDHLRTTYEV